MKLEAFLQKRNTHLPWRVASHIVFWLVFYLAFAYLNQISLNPLSDSLYGYLEPVHNTVALVVVFYALVYWVFPNFIFKKRWFLSVLCLLVLLVVFAMIVYLGESLIVNYCESCRDIIAENNAYYLDYLNKGFLSVMISRLLSLGIFLQLIINLMIPVAIKGGLSYHQSYVRNLQLAQDNVQLELSFLKAQMNPHFLFNTLNNLYGLIIAERTDESAQTVSRLSDFMRYTLYDSSQQEVLLEKELALIKNYLELEQLRLNQTQVTFTPDMDESVKRLPPLLFLPLIENAFKYVNDDSEKSCIDMTLKLHKGQLDFTIHNSFNPDQGNSEVGGIGLTNFKKRLMLHFPNNHDYDVSVIDSSYTAHLTLQFL